MDSLEKESGLRSSVNTVNETVLNCCGKVSTDMHSCRKMTYTFIFTLQQLDPWLAEVANCVCQPRLLASGRSVIQLYKDTTDGLMD